MFAKVLKKVAPEKGNLNLSHPQIHLMDEFDILQIVGEGWFGKILLVEHKATDTEMVLKGKPIQLHLLYILRIENLFSPRGFANKKN